MDKKCECDSCGHNDVCKYEEHFRYAYDKILDTDVSMSSSPIVHIKDTPLISGPIVHIKDTPLTLGPIVHIKDTPFIKDINIHCKYKIPVLAKEMYNRGDVHK